ncbi:MAG: RNA polymerase sigma factor [Bacteroidales bacterium]|nr:RNA polymerase sigma factor [Bacteroidales bacterium]
MNYPGDEHIINQVLSGQTQAYALLINKHKNLAFSIALKVVHNSEDAEEITQDAFLKAYKNLINFKGTSTFKTWLYRIVYNTAISKTRKKRQEYTALDDHLIDNYSEDEIIENINEFSSDDKKYLITKILKQLPEQEYVIINLFYLEGLPIEDIVEVTGLSKSNVKVKLHRIRKKIYAEFNKETILNGYA